MQLAATVAVEGNNIKNQSNKIIIKSTTVNFLHAHFPDYSCHHLNP